jgi:hypothetical protein
MRIFLLFTFIFLTGCSSTGTIVQASTYVHQNVTKSIELLENISVRAKNNGFVNDFTLDKGKLSYISSDAYGDYYSSAKKVRQVVPVGNIDKEVSGGLYIPFDPRKNHSLFIDVHNSSKKVLNVLNKKASIREVLVALSLKDWGVAFGDSDITFDPKRDYSLLAGSSYLEILNAFNKEVSISELSFNDWNLAFKKDSIEDYETARGSSRHNNREQLVNTLCFTTGNKSLSLSFATTKISTSAGSDATVIIRVDEQKPQHFQATAFNYNGVSLPISNKLLDYMSSGDNLRYRVNPSVPGHDSFEGSTSLNGFKEMTQSAMEFCNK